MRMDVLKILGRKQRLFAGDIGRHNIELADKVRAGRFLVIGGAGSIGQAVVRELFKRSPKVLHVVDISENNLVELVRSIRSSLGYTEGEFRTFALDFGSVEFQALIGSSGGYDYVLNLAALKHVRSEKDPYTLMRMINTNVLHTEALRRWCAQTGATKMFCVSTDKATNPVNMMGCSKRIMELFLFGRSDRIPISTARFANVAFSDGSLLHGFDQRIALGQPLSVPVDVRRYFITQEESGLLCLMSCLLGKNRDIFFPKLSSGLHLTGFREITVRYLESLGFEAVACESEQEARESVDALKAKDQWPVYFFNSDTTGEKPFEEFFQQDAVLDLARFQEIGIVKQAALNVEDKLRHFEKSMACLQHARRWDKRTILSHFQELVPEFEHEEKERYLDDRM